MHFFLSFILIVTTLSITTANDKVKLSDIKALTLNYGLKTNGRRSAPVPQLECVGGSASCRDKLLPRVVQCINVGSDGYDEQWKCEAELAKNLKFGHIDVNCEGYDYPNDRYVLRGSCGLRYTLDVTGTTGNTFGGDKKSFSSEKFDSSATNGILFFVFCVAICALIYFFCISNTHGSSDETQFRSSAPPPPPGFRPEYTGPPPHESIYRDKRTHTTAGNGDGRPGFWTGLGAGGLAGYLFGSRTNYQQAPYHQPTSGWSTPYTQYGNDYTSTSRRRHDSDESREQRSASGFGGTSRR